MQFSSYTEQKLIADFGASYSSIVFVFQLSEVMSYHNYEFKTIQLYLTQDQNQDKKSNEEAKSPLYVDAFYLAYAEETFGDEYIIFGNDQGKVLFIVIFQEPDSVLNRFLWRRILYTEKLVELPPMQTR